MSRSTRFHKFGNGFQKFEIFDRKGEREEIWKKKTQNSEKKIDILKNHMRYSTICTLLCNPIFFFLNFQRHSQCRQHRTPVSITKSVSFLWPEKEKKELFWTREHCILLINFCYNYHFKLAQYSRRVSIVRECVTFQTALSTELISQHSTTSLNAIYSTNMDKMQSTKPK